MKINDLSIKKHINIEVILYLLSIAMSYYSPIVMIVVYSYKIYYSKQYNLKNVLILSLSFAFLAYRWNPIPNWSDLARHQAYIGALKNADFFSELLNMIRSISPLRTISLLIVSRFGNPDIIQLVSVFLSIILTHLLVSTLGGNDQKNSRSKLFAFYILICSIYVLGIFSSLFYINATLLLSLGILRFNEDRKLSLILIVVSIGLHFSMGIILVVICSAVIIYKRFYINRHSLTVVSMIVIAALIFALTPLIAYFEPNIPSGILKVLSKRYISYVQNQSNIGVFSNIPYLLTEYSKCFVVIIGYVLIKKSNYILSKQVDEHLFLSFFISIFVITIGLNIRVLNRFSYLSMVLFLPSYFSISDNKLKFYLTFLLSVYLIFQSTYHLYSLYNVGLLTLWR